MQTIGSNFLYQGSDLLDAKLTAPSFEDVINEDSEYYILADYRFKGLTVTVKEMSADLKKSADVWLVGGTSDKMWRLKNIAPLTKVSELESIPYDLCYVGLELNVKDVTYQVVTKNTTNGVVWEEKKSGVDSSELDDIKASLTALTESVNGAYIAIDHANEDLGKLAEDIEKIPVGQTVYISTEVYKYTDENGDTQFAATEEEANEKKADDSEVVKMEPGAYIQGETEKNGEKTVELQKIVTTITNTEIKDIPVSGGDVEE